MITIQEKMNMELKKFREHVTTCIQEIFEKEKEVYPVLFVLARIEGKMQSGIVAGLGRLFATDAGKDRAAELMKEMNKELKPIAIAFVSEGWYTTYNTPGDLESRLTPDGKYKNEEDRPSNSPDRKEMLFINFETFDKDAKICWDIVREDDKEPRLDLKIDQGWEQKSKELPKTRFSNLLEENYSQVAQELTKELVNHRN